MKEKERHFVNGSISTLKAIINVVSLLRIMIPSLNYFLEEEILSMLDVSFDPTMLPWLVFLLVLGFEVQRAKKLGKLPKWMPEPTLLTLAAAFVICAFFAWIKHGVTCFADVGSVMSTGFINACLITAICTFGQKYYEEFVTDKLPLIKEKIAQVKANVAARKEKAAEEAVTEIEEPQEALNV